MTKAQTAAYVTGHAASLNAEIAAMQAENDRRMRYNLAQAYDEAMFQSTIDSHAHALNDTAMQHLFANTED